MWSGASILTTELYIPSCHAESMDILIAFLTGPHHPPFRTNCQLPSPFHSPFDVDTPSSTSALCTEALVVGKPWSETQLSTN